MGEYDLSGRNVIVTGAGRGLGRAMTEALTEAGANVVAAAHISDDFPELEKACSGHTGKLHCVTADIRQPEECDRLVAEAHSAFGAIHGLVNNAGLTFTYIWPDGHKREAWRETGEMPKFWEASDEIIQNVLDTNFVGADQLTRRFAPLMVEQGWGRIINVTTMYRTMTKQGGSPYGPSKAALECATEIWNKDLEGTGVTVNILNPGAGAITPGMSEEMKARDKTLEKPVLIEADLMKAPIVWLMSDATDDITGMRYDAKPWDPSKPAADEAERIGAKAGVLLYSMPDY
ncbi:MAG: SDR family oxidoreductase [Alphaproteobacteria bacterium]|nr:SDR family oxidoreductase [Alphaproteobacteria bacterium]